MNRTDARERWQRIASGDLKRAQYDPVDLLAWIEAVAAEVLKADDGTDSKQRVYDLTKAIGLGNREESWPELRAVLEVREDFEQLDKPARGEERQGLLRTARSIYPGWEHIGDDEVAKRIDRVLKSIRRNV